MERRLAEHNAGIGANYTARRLPVKLIYYEEYRRIDEAYCRERQIHGWSHAKKKALIEQNRKTLHHHAECKNESNWKNAPLKNP